MARAVTGSRKALNTAIAGTLGFLIFFPILWIVILSFKSEGDAIKAPLEVLFGTGWTMESFGTVQARSDYFKHFSNSVIISVGSTFLGLLNAVPAAWSMAHSSTGLNRAASSSIRRGAASCGPMRCLQVSRMGVSPTRLLTRGRENRGTVRTCCALPTRLRSPTISRFPRPSTKRC